MRYLLSIIMAILLSCLAEPCFATGMEWSGSLEVGPTYNAGSRDTVFESDLGVRLELNTDDKQSGMILLQYKAKTPESPGDGEDGYNTLRVNQAYLDLALSPVSMLRAGRQKISWGSGLAWNPTNYIGTDKNRADLTNEFPGVDAIDFETVFGQSSLAVVAKPTSSFVAWGEAFKFATRIGHGDLAFSSFRQGSANGFGFDWAASLGDYTVYTELASKTGNGRFYITDSGGWLIPATRPEGVRYLNGVLGVNRTFVNDWLIQLEYYYNGAGWSAGEAGNYDRYIQDPANQGRVGDLAAETARLFGDLRRNYLYVLVRKAEVVDDLTLTVRILCNMDDGSGMITPVAEYRLGQSRTATFMINLFTGNGLTEFGGVPTGTQYFAKLNFVF